MVIEVVFEDMALKRDISTRLDAVMKQGAVLATHTSAPDVDAMAAATARQEAVIGLPFFSPANIRRTIGRTSCPESVWTYVLQSGVGGSCKIKRTTRYNK